MEAVNALSTLSQVSETQLDTEAIMHELSVDSEVTFHNMMGLTYQITYQMRPHHGGKLARPLVGRDSAN